MDVDKSSRTRACIPAISGARDMPSHITLPHWVHTYRAVRTAFLAARICRAASLLLFFRMALLALLAARAVPGLSIHGDRVQWDGSAMLCGWQSCAADSVQTVQEGFRLILVLSRYMAAWSEDSHARVRRWVQQLHLIAVCRNAPSPSALTTPWRRILSFLSQALQIARLVFQPLTLTSRSP